MWTVTASETGLLLRNPLITINLKMRLLVIIIPGY